MRYYAMYFYTLTRRLSWCFQPWKKRSIRFQLRKNQSGPSNIGPSLKQSDKRDPMNHICSLFSIYDFKNPTGKEIRKEHSKLCTRAIPEDRQKYIPNGSEAGWTRPAIDGGQISMPTIVVFSSSSLANINACSLTVWFSSSKSFYSRILSK